MHKDLTAFMDRYGLPTDARKALSSLLIDIAAEITTKVQQTGLDLSIEDAVRNTLASVDPLAKAPPTVTSETLPPSSIDVESGHLRSLLGDGATLGTHISLHNDSHIERREVNTQHADVALSPRRDSRYEDLGLLGVGGMGEVRRVRDSDLNRVLAMKIIKSSLVDRPSVLARFVEEAQVNAQLQHPGILPVHEIGRLADGRYYFTMQEVRGQTLADVIDAYHGSDTSHANRTKNADPADDKNGENPKRPRWTLRRLVDVFRRVCEAIGYAHARGVIHRDLKPQNIMVGRTGEVLVVDWGLAKLIGAQEQALSDDVLPIESSRSAAAATHMGAVAGTPAYMPPEQALGEIDRLDARSDVYALGSILYELLSGKPPHHGLGTRALLMRLVMATPPPALDEVCPQRPPEELAVACHRAMSHEQDERPPNATALAAEIGEWLDGARLRDRALELVDEALILDRGAQALMERASAERAAGARLLEAVPTSAPEEAKHEGWGREDQANAQELEAALTRLRTEQRFHAALSYVPGLLEAHEALCKRHEAEHRVMEAARDDHGAARARSLLEIHVAALPLAHPQRLHIHRYLAGDGTLTLRTEPAGAEVTLYRYVLRHRRLVPERLRSLGVTPLIEAPLEMGSYLLILERDGFEPTRYPVSIDRCQRWSGVRPGDDTPTPIPLLQLGSLAPDEVYIPPGRFQVGGDAIAAESFPRADCWIDGFIMRRFPVTNTEYLEFLNDLVAQGREAEALRHAPRERVWAAGDSDATVIYARDARGMFSLQPDADGDVWEPHWPVVMVDWLGARAFCAWLSAKTSRMWRLPAELEWEKAARGVDGRFYPWGDFLDPSWCCMRFSHAGRPLPSPVDDYPVDKSPFGVRGVAGNARQWCLDIYTDNAPPPTAVFDLAPVLASTSDTTASRVVRGGSWDFDAQFGRPAQRNFTSPHTRNGGMGFRIARDVE